MTVHIPADKFATFYWVFPEEHPLLAEPQPETDE